MTHVLTATTWGSGPHPHTIHGQSPIARAQNRKRLTLWAIKYVIAPHHTLINNPFPMCSRWRPKNWVASNRSANWVETTPQRIYMCSVCLLKCFVSVAYNISCSNVILRTLRMQWHSCAFLPLELFFWMVSLIILSIGLWLKVVKSQLCTCRNQKACTFCNCPETFTHSTLHSSSFIK